jgi:sec-independent protein translocase protein TatA
MFGFHAWDLLIVLLIVVLLFGARRLPELGSSLGKSFNMLQKGLNGETPPAIDGEKEREQVERLEPPAISEDDN